MNDVFLGLIALGVLVMAIIQVGVVVFAARTARRVGDAVTRLEADVKPIVSNLQALSADAARATSKAAAQVDRAERLVEDVSRRVDETMAVVQESIVTPARQGAAMLQGLMAAFGAFRGAPASPRPQGPATVDDDDALFIG